MIRFLVLLAALVFSVAAHAPDKMHYDVRTTIAADGTLDADVRFTLPADAAGTGKAFLLGRRFVLTPGGFGVT